MIDSGLDWLGKLKRVDPSAIVLTHAHPDYAWGLKRGAPCPVYAPQKTWQELQYYPITDRHVIDERTPTKICGITFEAFPVEHSILSPAVGYRVSAGRVGIFYAPDLIFIHDRKAALDGAQLYIGDGATVTRSFIRKRGKALIGHSPVRTQLTWSQKKAFRARSSPIADRKLSPAIQAKYPRSFTPSSPNAVLRYALPMTE